ncbi:hypothetical protein [Dyella silvatica]
MKITVITTLIANGKLRLPAGQGRRALVAANLCVALFNRSWAP